MLTVFATLTKLLFVFAYGACVGSLINVLVYRMPLGLNVVTPSSRCPRCRTVLSWKDNIPVLGWLRLAGRCRYCRSPISPEYPIVEAITGLLFVLAYAVIFGPEWWFGAGDVSILGVPWEQFQPEWAQRGAEQAWPFLVLIFVLIGSLVAVTIIDARTFMIPLILVWIPTVLSVVVHVGMAVIWQTRAPWRITTAEGWSYAIASPGPEGWRWAGAAIGGVVGLGISALAVKLGLMRQSYADYDEWERHARAERGLPEPAEPAAASDDDPDDATEDSEPTAPIDPEVPPERPPWPWAQVRITAACALVFAITGGLLAPSAGAVPLAGVLAGLFVTPIAAGLLVRVLVKQPSAADSADATCDEAGGSGQGEGDPSDMWLMYPHARRESLKEIVFIGPALGLAVIGAWLFGVMAGPWEVNPIDPAVLSPATQMPLWLDALAGVLLGYLIGGGIVWAVRILGSLAYGKEAMGIGDVHLMAAVGACLGWIDPVLAFFVAAFLALWIELIKRCWPGGEARGAMPFGPALAGATLIVFFAKLWFEDGLGSLMGRALSLP